MTGPISQPPFTASILDQACQFLWPVLINDASNISSLRSHDSQLAGVAALELAAYPHSRPLYGLMSSRYRRASAIGAHIAGEGLHLTSMTQLSRRCRLAAHPLLYAVSDERVAPYGRREDRSSRRQFRTGHATFTASGSSLRKPLIWAPVGLRLLAWSFVFLCLSAHAHEHGTTRCVNTPAMPGNKSLLLTTFSYVSVYLPSSLFLTVFTSAYPGHCPRPLLLEQSSSWLHWVEPTRIIEVSPICHTRAYQEFPRSESSFVAVLG
jgi:hypothetical protein